VLPSKKYFHPNQIRLQENQEGQEAGRLWPKVKRPTMAKGHEANLIGGNQWPLDLWL